MRERPSTIIRPADGSDRGEVERIVRDAYAKYIERIGKKPGPMLDDYARLIADGAVWVAAEGARLLGVLVLLAESDHMLLDNVAVAPAAQGTGLGRKLISFAENEAARRGFGEIRLYTHQLMHENIKMYPRLGYEETGRGEQAGYARVFYRKRLASPAA
ncbi:MAG: GNAT family N-acetyltransferase [Caulobacteraceae bacterium]|nr:GNAT family N-acetyltransferase [Caulobacteraceae bacterium]